MSRKDQENTTVLRQNLSDDELLAALTEEAKSLWVPTSRDSNGVGPTHRAAEAERKLFARIDAHDAAVLKRATFGGGASVWGPLAAVTALAAGVMFFLHPGESNLANDANRSTPRLETKGSPATIATTEIPRPTAPARLAVVTPGTEVRIDGLRTEPEGLSMRDGESIETRGGIASFAAPERVAWLLESGTEVTALRAGTHGGAIVLGLRVGAVEAQVTPVPRGEAFAVDVEGVRVAVHGTHLRVARESVAHEKQGGSWVVVDLTEGVISIGTPPKAGSTVGILVTAPAHVEFSTADLNGTLRVEHDPSRVRSPVDPAAVGRRPGSIASIGSTGSTALASAPPVDAPVGPTAGLNSRGPTPPIAKPSNPSDLVAAAVRSCADQTLHGGTGSITISSMLTVDVNPDGLARLASFDPPLVPDLQACVGRAVYAIRWGEPGPHQIPIELHR